MFTTNKDLIKRFEYKKADPERLIKHEDVRAVVIALAVDLNAMLPEGREKASAFTKLQEVMFWANAAVAMHEPSVGKG
jgi:hypothetical protein